MNSLLVLYRILRKFYRGLKRIEKIFFYTFIIDMVTYVSLFVGALFLTTNPDIYFMYIPILFFPIISGIITFYGKTIYHGLAFLGVHSFPVFGSIAYYYTQYFNCRDHLQDSCISDDPTQKFYQIGVAFIVVLVVLFQFLHTLYVYILWKKRIWPLVYEFKYSKHNEIKEMHAVRDEKNYLMYIVYVGNIVQAILLYLDLSAFCKQLILKSESIIKNTIQCVNYSNTYTTFALYACLCWIVLALSTWNTIRCHRNFNRHMAFYIKYEPTPPEFKSGRKLVIRKSITVPDYLKIV
ncbi:hypothetical protein GLOIN_2v1717641 [Rhizophagus clarus]|uniref:Uncharacterized protein n=1 Tax=Rhizophagus clarus TaxID=94130 RepID=A0A8H3LUL5_9GLOM|nr:hypothetical protein GLOIN_2v1717641 [Rhizophagus clarus]